MGKRREGLQVSQLDLEEDGTVVNASLASPRPLRSSPGKSGTCSSGSGRTCSRGREVRACIKERERVCVCEED